jgi:integrase
MVAFDILTSLRRGELFALRWKDIDEDTRTVTVSQAMYNGQISAPKTEAGLRQVPLSNDVWKLLMEWKGKAEDSGPDSLVFSTKVSTALNSNNVLRRAVFPVCKCMGIPDVTWLTCRRTYASWSHTMGVPRKSHRAADGSLERRRDARRVHAGVGRIGTRGGGKSLGRLVHKNRVNLVRLTPDATKARRERAPASEPRERSGAQGSPRANE